MLIFIVEIAKSPIFFIYTFYLAYAQFKDDPDGSQGEKGGQPTPSVLPPYSDAPPPAHMVGSGPVMSPSIIRQQTVFIPKDYFGLALFVTVCCFLPLGIVALVKSSDVSISKHRKKQQLRTRLRPYGQCRGPSPALQI